MNHRATRNVIAHTLGELILGARRADMTVTIEEYRPAPRGGVPRSNSWHGTIDDLAERLATVLTAQTDPAAGRATKEQAVLDRLAQVDIRDSAAAWDLGMAIIAIFDGPGPPAPRETTAPPTIQDAGRHQR